MSLCIVLNDDWKVGVYDVFGVDLLDVFVGMDKVVVMGWFKLIGDYFVLNFGMVNLDDVYNVIGLVGVFIGILDGYVVWVLFEVIMVDGEFKFVVFGCCVDGVGFWMFVVDLLWDEIFVKG